MAKRRRNKREMNGMSSVDVMEREMTPPTRSDMYESMKQEIMQELLRDLKDECEVKMDKEETEAPLTFGQRLKMLREERGLSRSMLCQILGVTASAVSMWEQDKITPHGPNLRRIAHVFNLTVSELLQVKTLDNPREIRAVSLCLKLTDDEHQKLIERAQQEGIKKSTFARDTLVNSLGM